MIVLYVMSCHIASEKTICMKLLICSLFSILTVVYRVGYWGSERDTRLNLDNTNERVRHHCDQLLHKLFECYTLPSNSTSQKYIRIKTVFYIHLLTRTTGLSTFKHFLNDSDVQMINKFQSRRNHYLL